MYPKPWWILDRRRKSFSAMPLAASAVVPWNNQCSLTTWVAKTGKLSQIRAYNLYKLIIIKYHKIHHKIYHQVIIKLSKYQKTHTHISLKVGTRSVNSLHITVPQTFRNYSKWISLCKCSGSTCSSRGCCAVKFWGGKLGETWWGTGLFAAGQVSHWQLPASGSAYNSSTFVN